MTIPHWWEPRSASDCLLMVHLSLTTQELKPGSRLIATTKARFLELLRLRYSSPLFRLPSAAHIQKQLRHHNTGPDQARVGTRDRGGIWCQWLGAGGWD